MVYKIGVKFNKFFCHSLARFTPSHFAMHQVHKKYNRAYANALHNNEKSLDFFRKNYAVVCIHT